MYRLREFEGENLVVVSFNGDIVVAVSLIFEINLVGGFVGWWLDTGSSIHVCNNRATFKTYTTADDKKVLLGDVHTTIVADIGDVGLKFTSGKIQILKDVKHTPDIR